MAFFVDTGTCSNNTSLGIWHIEVFDHWKKKVFIALQSQIGQLKLIIYGVNSKLFRKHWWLHPTPPPPSIPTRKRWCWHTPPPPSCIPTTYLARAAVLRCGRVLFGVARAAASPPPYGRRVTLGIAPLKPWALCWYGAIQVLRNDFFLEIWPPPTP